jgi:hypothetical protein
MIVVAVLETEGLRVEELEKVEEADEEQDMADVVFFGVMKM